MNGHRPKKMVGSSLINLARKLGTNLLCSCIWAFVFSVSTIIIFSLLYSVFLSPIKSFVVFVSWIFGHDLGADKGLDNTVGIFLLGISGFSGLVGFILAYLNILPAKGPVGIFSLFRNSLQKQELLSSEEELKQHVWHPVLSVAGVVCISYALITPIAYYLANEYIPRSNLPLWGDVICSHAFLSIIVVVMLKVAIELSDNMKKTQFVSIIFPYYLGFAVWPMCFCIAMVCLKILNIM